MSATYDLVEEARAFATYAHGSINQTRKYTGEPYITHPEEVAQMVAAFGLSDEAIAAALLHDVVEDTPVEIEEIFECFGQKVGEYVAFLTDPNQSEGSRQERKRRVIEKMMNAPSEVHSIKLCDLISNTKSIVAHDRNFAEIYLDEKSELLKVLTRGHLALQVIAAAILKSSNRQILNMGGNALKACTTRLTKERYEQETDRVLWRLRQLPGRKAVIPAYAKKETFGDMDILISSSDGYDPNTFAAALEATETVKNGDVTSLGWKCEEGIFQVDLIKVPENAFDFAYRYFAMNDLGNLIGRIAHKAGFKFGHLGLQYVVRDPDNSEHVVREILVTHDFHKALSFLGFNPAVYEEGLEGEFKTLQDIFSFVTSGEYFNKEIFLLENRNAIARKRDSKRPTYRAFLVHIENIPEKSLTTSLNRDHFLETAKALFPEFARRHKAALRDIANDKLFRSRFNGKIISERTGFKGKELGEFIQQMIHDQGGLAALKARTLEDEDFIRRCMENAFIADRKRSPR